MTKKIIFSSGGTGGHIFPAINLMKYFSNKGYDVLLVTDIRGNIFLKNHTQFRSCIISTDTPSNKNFFRKIFSFIMIFFSIIVSILILRKEKPDLIIGFGGYVSFPISFSSRFYGIPLVIYENNLVLGRTNKNLLTPTQVTMLLIIVQWSLLLILNHFYLKQKVTRSDLITFPILLFAFGVSGGHLVSKLLGRPIPSDKPKKERKGKHKKFKFLF